MRAKSLNFGKPPVSLSDDHLVIMIALESMHQVPDLWLLKADIPSVFLEDVPFFETAGHLVTSRKGVALRRHAMRQCRLEVERNRWRVATGLVPDHGVVNAYLREFPKLRILPDGGLQAAISRNGSFTPAGHTKRKPARTEADEKSRNLNA